MEDYLKIDGFEFTTLTVDGRGKTAYAVDATSIYGRDGAMLRMSTLEPRTIIVRAKVSARTNELYRKGMTNLNLLLYSRMVHAIKFTDEEPYTFYGVVVSVQDEDERSNTQTVEIEFACHDPFKYSDTKTVTTTNAEPLVLQTQLPVVPEEIAITFSTAADAQDFTLNNTTTEKRIRYQQDGTASGTTIRIRQKADYIGYNDSVNHIGGLNVDASHFDEFSVISGDQLVVTPEPTAISIKYKGASV